MPVYLLPNIFKLLWISLILPFTKFDMISCTSESSSFSLLILFQVLSSHYRSTTWGGRRWWLMHGAFDSFRTLSRRFIMSDRRHFGSPSRHFALFIMRIFISFSVPMISPQCFCLPIMCGCALGIYSTSVPGKHFVWTFLLSCAHNCFPSYHHSIFHIFGSSCRSVTFLYFYVGY